MSIGVCSPTLSLLHKTFVIEFEKTLISWNIPYKKDKQKNIIIVGSMTIFMFAIDQPELVYGFNISVCLVDEIDELPQAKALSAFSAVQERTRIVLPDGRIPFTVFTTTAQGFRGTYQILQDLRKANQQYIKIRGRTIDNKSLSPSYYNRLFALYNENERLAFLEGEFVNLTTGRVYPEFNSDNNVIPNFEVGPHETIYIGQDLNTGYSKAVAFIIREANIYAIKDFSFASIGHAPAIIRGEWPQNRILWFPDASSKEIMAGYRQEILENDIELRMGNVNPPILERIFIKNKLLAQRRLYIFEKCEQYIIALKTRCFDKNGQPEKGSGEKAPDHLCDSSEYCLFRIVSSEPQFFDLWSMSRSFKEG